MVYDIYWYGKVVSILRIVIFAKWHLIFLNIFFQISSWRKLAALLLLCVVVTSSVSISTFPAHPISCILMCIKMDMKMLLVVFNVEIFHLISYDSFWLFIWHDRALKASIYRSLEISFDDSFCLSILVGGNSTFLDVCVFYGDRFIVSELLLYV